MVEEACEVTAVKAVAKESVFHVLFFTSRVNSAVVVCTAGIETASIAAAVMRVEASMVAAIVKVVPFLNDRQRDNISGDGSVIGIRSILDWGDLLC